MPQGRKSFFERLTGTVHVEDDAYENEEEVVSVKRGREPLPRGIKPAREERNAGRNAEINDWAEEEPAAEEAQLTVDVYQTPDEIIVKTIVAGVRPSIFLASSPIAKTCLVR